MLDLGRQIAQLEARFSRPRRADLDGLAAQLDYRGCEPGAALWAQAIAAGQIPVAWADDPGRRFHATAKQLLALSPRGNTPDMPPGPGRLPSPATAREALIFASDPDGLEAAEGHARELLTRLEIWGAPVAEGVTWRLAGHAIAPSRARPPSFAELAPTLACVRAVLGGSDRIYELRHLHRRFQPIVDVVSWSQRWQAIAQSEIPARVGSLEVPAALVGRSLAELPSPLEPWLALVETGYVFAGVRTGASGRTWIELHAPFPLPKLSVVPGLRDPPRPVWSQRETGLRLACARGDVGHLARDLPLHPDAPVPGEPDLIHFAAYGGPAVLELLDQHGRLDLDARDRDHSTALMLAAGLPPAGPGGAAPYEMEVPISEIIGAGACEWLLARGAPAEARDRDGRTALHHAAANQRVRSLAALLDGGADPDAVDARGRTALMLAAAHAYRQHALEGIDRLLAAGADPDVRDHNGWTVLHHHYAANVGSRAAASVVSRLMRAGARMSRDRGGRTPAELGRRHPTDLPPGDAAAGPGRPPLGPLQGAAPLLEPLLDELAPPVAPEPDPTRARARARARAPSQANWMVLADWLQSIGDPRGELVATSLVCARVGRRQRRAMADALATLAARCQPLTHAGLECADPLAAARPSPIELRWTHGFVTAATLRYGLDPRATRAAVHALLDLEPLLAELHIGCLDARAWPELLGEFETRAPARLRRLSLHDLPAELPDLDGLAATLPALRSLSLIGADKIRAGTLRWPGLTHLRLRHGSTSEWSQGNVDLRLEPSLRHLDLALPSGSRTTDDEIRGVVETLADLDALEDLRLGPVTADFAAAILPSPRAAGLRTLDLVRTRGSALDQLVAHAERLRGLARVRVSITATVAAQRRSILAQLRQALPQLEVEVRPTRTQP